MVRRGGVLASGSAYLLLAVACQGGSQGAVPPTGRGEDQVDGEGAGPGLDCFTDECRSVAFKNVRIVRTLPLGSGLSCRR